MALRAGQRAVRQAIAAFDRGQGRRHKYHASPTVVDGIRFDSKKEATRYGELRVMAKSGRIVGLRCQPIFSLWAYAGVDRAPVPIGTYVADFDYTDAAGELVVEDVKGFKTPLYRWKKRHVEAQYGIRIQEI